MSKRLFIAICAVAFAGGALVVRDLSNPIESPPMPSLLVAPDAGGQSTPLADDNPFVSIEGPASPIALDSAVSGDEVDEGPSQADDGGLVGQIGAAGLGPQVSQSPSNTTPIDPPHTAQGGSIRQQQPPSSAQPEPTGMQQRSGADRFPSVAQSGDMSRFPSPRPQTREISTPVQTRPQARPDSDGARISLGGGAVQITSPWDWYVYEISEGRQVRFVLSPTKMRTRDDLVDGLWVVCHVTRFPKSPAALPELLAKRAGAATRGMVAASEMTQIRIGSSEGVRQEFAMQNAVGFHALIQASWGVCEIHGRTANPQLSKRMLDSIMNTLEIRDAATRRGVLNQRVAASAELIGSWKAYRSRLRLGGDGRIEIEPEASAVRALGESPGAETRVLRGDYESRDDLLFVRWDDGSFLNFRWRLDGDSLLLTDHDGRISELRLLLE